MRRFRLLLIVLLTLTGLGGLASVAPVGAAPTPGPSKFKFRTRIAKLEVDVAGYVETRRLHDTTSDCSPGERWIQTNHFDFETGSFVPLSVKNVSGPGFGSIATGSFSRTTGSTMTKGSISDYSATNYCAPTEPDKLTGPPACAAAGRNRIAVALTPGGIPEPANPDDPAPLKGRSLQLTIKRVGGGTDTPKCAGEGAQSLTGPGTETAVVGTSFAPGISEILPANLDAVKVFAIRRRQRLRRTIVMQGPCSRVAVKVLPVPGPAPSPGGLNADGDCWLTGKVVLTVRARR
ncbi:MAG: hypothetical protein JWM31_3270 [Solirubrobacterales bacterium]|nr:hypothetical protein [Solirubrobacterales bacterium]